MSSHTGPNGSAGDDPNDGWPSTPSQLVYHIDAVVNLFERVRGGERLDLLEALLACADWREMFGGEGAGFLTVQQLDQLRNYYRSRFAGIERFYLAEQLSTELLTAMIAGGDLEMSPDLKQLGRERPDLWNEIRTFFSRKEFATALLVLADEVPATEPSP